MTALPTHVFLGSPYNPQIFSKSMFTDWSRVLVAGGQFLFTAQVSKCVITGTLLRLFY